MDGTMRVPGTASRSGEEGAGCTFLAKGWSHLLGDLMVNWSGLSCWDRLGQMIAGTWVANLEDCIVGLDILGALDCVINARSGTLTFPDGEVVQMLGRPPKLDYTVNHNVTVLTTESVEDNPSLVALMEAGAITASDGTRQVLGGAHSDATGVTDGCAACRSAHCRNYSDFSN